MNGLNPSTQQALAALKKQREANNLLRHYLKDVIELLLEIEGPGVRVNAAAECLGDQPILEEIKKMESGYYDHQN